MGLGILGNPFSCWTPQLFHLYPCENSSQFRVQFSLALLGLGTREGQGPL